MASWETVRELTAKLPESEERTSWGKPSLFVRKKLFACMSTSEEGALVLRLERDERRLMLDSQPEVFYLTPHYTSATGSSFASTRSSPRSSRTGSSTPGASRRRRSSPRN